MLSAYRVERQWARESFTCLLHRLGIYHFVQSLPRSVCSVLRCCGRIPSLQIDIRHHPETQIPVQPTPGDLAEATVLFPGQEPYGTGLRMPERPDADAPQEGGHLIATAGPGHALAPPSGKTDLLLRFFDSQFFDEWICLT